MNPAADFTRHVPGFDFLQSLLKGAGSGMPAAGKWIAPTLDPAELDKRIQELKTVQFWLEQNARLLATTIQALEVQRMTLATLKTMNMPMADLAQSLMARPEPAPAAKKAAKPEAKAEAQPAAAAPALVDPMQWWGALTQQFSDLAAQAMKDSARDLASFKPTPPSAKAAAAGGPKARAGSRAGRASTRR